jgi:hypothetical protein
VAWDFKLHDAGVGLGNFVSFMERKQASHITTPLALEWASSRIRPQVAKPANRSPAYLHLSPTGTIGTAEIRAKTSGPDRHRPSLLGCMTPEASPYSESGLGSCGRRRPTTPSLTSGLPGNDFDGNVWATADGIAIYGDDLGERRRVHVPVLHR